MEIANRAFAPFRDSISWLWQKFDVPMPPVLAADTYEGIAATGHRYAGDPAGARAWVAEHAETAGVNYFSLEFCFGDMTAAETLRSAELFATEVMPAFTLTAPCCQPCLPALSAGTSWRWRCRASCCYPAKAGAPAAVWRSWPSMKVATTSRAAIRPGDRGGVFRQDREVG